MRILLLQLKRIGDLILTTPAIWALRQHFPEAHLALAVEGGSSELLPAIDFVDRTFVYQRAGQNGALWRHLLFRHYDVCLDFTGTDRSALFAALSKAATRATFTWVKRSRFRHMFYNQFVASSVRENHTADHYLHLLQALEVPAPAGGKIVLHLPEWAESKAARLREEIGVKGPYIVVHPGTARPEKYWAAQNWAEVVRQCEDRLGLPCVLTGTRDGHEQSELTALKRAYPAVAGRDLSGKADLLTLAALEKSAALVLSVDSAPMHLAGAFGTPQVALFGPTNPFHWHPRQERAVLVGPQGRIDPAELRPQTPGGPMSEVSTGAVIDAIFALQIHARDRT